VLILSEYLLRQLERTLGKRYFVSKVSPGQINPFLATIHAQGEMTTVSDPVRRIATHPEDDLILAAVASAQVDYLVTGDRQLQALQSHRRTEIVSPAEFIAILDAAR